MLEFRIDKNLVCGGQPDPHDLARYRNEGLRTVVDVREPNEEGHPADERDQVERLGMRYVAFPVNSDTQLTLERATELSAVLRHAEQPVLVHCKSGNRVGALLALLARHEEGRSVNEAMAFGRKAGMTTAEAKVRRLLEANERVEGHEPVD